MLSHFFSMFVDKYTYFLDPTCGAGSSLRTADFLGAASICGLEIDESHCANAQLALRNARILRSAERSLR